MNMKIEIERDVLQQTLDAICYAHATNRYESERQTRAIASIRAALLVPVAEHTKLGPGWTPCTKLPVVVHVRQHRPGEQHVSTREGITPVKPDDLIMRGVSGEEYPICRAIFDQTYTLETSPAPPPLVPMLTRDEIWRIWNNDIGIDEMNQHEAFKFARAITSKQCARKQESNERTRLNCFRI